jgi:hypothetical protein
MCSAILYVTSQKPSLGSFPWWPQSTTDRKDNLHSSLQLQSSLWESAPDHGGTGRAALAARSPHATPAIPIAVPRCRAEQFDR